MDGEGKKFLRDVVGVIVMVAALDVAMQLKDPTSTLRLRVAELKDRLDELAERRREWRRVAAEMRSDLNDVISWRGVES